MKDYQSQDYPTVVSRRGFDWPVNTLHQGSCASISEHVVKLHVEIVHNVREVEKLLYRHMPDETLCDVGGKIAEIDGIPFVDHEEEVQDIILYKFPYEKWSDDKTELEVLAVKIWTSNQKDDYKWECITPL